MVDRSVESSRQQSRLTVGRLVAAIRRRVEHHSALRTARQASSTALARAAGSRILVLCYGNIYRSPLVAHLLRTNPLLEKFTIESAGFFPRGGRTCEERYLALLQSRGYDLSGHRSAVVTRQQAVEADLIVIMDRKNWGQLRHLDPSAAAKAVWIGAFTEHGQVEAADPYGKDEAQVLAIIEQLEAGAAAIGRRLAELSGAP
jgi:protein-tyrosine phosphatase